VEEANWGDAARMMQIIDRHTRLLMAVPVEGTDEGFRAYIDAGASQLPIGAHFSWLMLGGVCVCLRVKVSLMTLYRLQPPPQTQHCTTA
jgi:hypothetical protein